MTREEAIEIVKSAFSAWESEFRVPNEDWSEEHKALDMAIEALESRNTGEYINLNEAKEHFKYISSLDKEQILHILDRLPTATIEPKRGEWTQDYLFTTNGGAYGVVRCSECQWQQPMITNFCPMCGADMRGDDE